MRRYRAIETAILLLPCLLLVMATVGSAQQDEATFRVEPTEVDLGTIKAGTDAVATFTFHNDGDKEVKIIRAKPS